jgi:hypothetical protein
MDLWSRVMTVLLNFRPIFRYLPKNQITAFSPKSLLIDRSHDSYNTLNVSAEENVPLSKY